MSFLFKAAFWLGLVFYVLPPSAPLPPSASSELPTGSQVASAVIRGAVQLCRDNAETCARSVGAVTETVQREVVGEAVPAARDTLVPADLQVPFGGLAIPPGAAPKQAPLPPRRPA
ncbi:MAG: hypothetical protein K2X45_00700 [Phreatobacter sp.]|jgi:hypothetical protein|nr:hypothetical protein [Phreatobacter sp.]